MLSKKGRSKKKNSDRLFIRDLIQSPDPFFTLSTYPDEIITDIEERYG